jgi:drug/metabolite transporter (DMT)-like permease
LASFVYLVVVLSVGASLLWFWLLSRGAASRVSAFYFLTPIFGLAFGTLFLGEVVGPGDLVGLVAVALGIVLVQRG